MKRRQIIMLSLLSITGLALLYSTARQAAKPCQCFCAFDQDLRDKKPEDTPFRTTLTNSKGKTFDICVCAQRDLDHLRENPELIDNITDDMIRGANCCD